MARSEVNERMSMMGRRNRPRPNHGTRGSRESAGRRKVVRALAAGAVSTVSGLIGEAERSRPSFARHETFHPRHGWVKKGFDEACKDPNVFLRDDAPVVLGVGKNMVRSIRYWCSAFKVLERLPASSRGAGGFGPSRLGPRLLTMARV